MYRVKEIMSRGAADRATSLGIDPESFPLEEEPLEEYMTIIGEPYNVSVPQTYGELLAIIDSIFHPRFWCLVPENLDIMAI